MAQHMPHTAQVSLAELFRVFGRIGVLSFGGPAAQIALMHRELVETRSWLDEATFLRALSLCMMLPGPEAMQLATYAGWRLRGVAGGVLAGALFVLPGAVVIGTLVGVYLNFGEQSYVKSAFLGVQAAVVSIVLSALRGLSARALVRSSDYLIAVLAFAAIFVAGVPFPAIIAAAAIWGAVRGVPTPAPAQHTPTVASPGPALATLALWGALWLVPLVALSVAGAELLAALGWFFAKLAVVSFGGAYAVLAYMTQAMTVDYGWLDTGQMIAGLGLAETTPGPLILVTQFAAMLAGFGAGGAGLAVAAGVVALWATFLPCFLWIFLAAPHLERLSAAPRLAGALSGITAAVVGVIANLSLWFALHVLFTRVGAGPLALPLPDPASLSFPAAGLAALGAVVIFVWRGGMVTALALCALAGIGLSAVT